MADVRFPDDHDPDDHDPGDEDLSRPPPNPDDGGRRRGRPTKLTPELADAIVALLINGNYRIHAAKALGVIKSTWDNWITQGYRFPDGIYGQFLGRVEVAEAQFKARGVNMVANSGNPKLVLKYLGIKDPRHFGEYRGELGELKRRLAEREKEVAELRALVHAIETAATTTV